MHLSKIKRMMSKSWTVVWMLKMLPSRFSKKLALRLGPKLTIVFLTTNYKHPRLHESVIHASMTYSSSVSQNKNCSFLSPFSSPKITSFAIYYTMTILHLFMTQNYTKFLIQFLLFIYLFIYVFIYWHQ